jgi:hypothetical protein
VLLFGGRAGAALFADTWSWDGTAWTRLQPASSPPAREAHSMACDAARGRIVLFGGAGRFGAPLFGDAWEWDGTTWTELHAFPAPSSRSGHAMAWDALRGRAILFGGYDGATFLPLGDTWEWDGVKWTPRTPADGYRPQPRSRHALGYDAARGRVLLHGGEDRFGLRIADTWAYEDRGWRPLGPAGGAPALVEHALATDAARGRLVLFGGRQGAVPSQETWTWDDGSWTRRTVAGGPRARGGRLLRERLAMAWDTTRRRVVLFGGYRDGGYQNDHWEWDGSRWTEVPSSGGPVARPAWSAAYDERRQRLVLYGASGFSPELWEWDGTQWWSPFASPEPPNEDGPIVYDREAGVVRLLVGQNTWEWDGTRWLRIETGAAPPPGGALAYDSGRGRVVFFGGVGNPLPLDQTWEWSGSNWFRRLPATSPSPRMGHSLVYDPVRRRTVLFGGSTGTQDLADLWEWDGTNWAFRVALPAPVPRAAHGAVHDPVRAAMLVFGGNAGTVYRDDTWEYFARTDTVGLGHPGGGVPLLCEAPPRPGMTMRFAFPNPGGQAFLALGHAPALVPGLALDPPFTCARGTLHLFPQAVVPLAGDPAVLELLIPAGSALVGQAFLLQGLALESGSCFRLTNALVAIVQP